MLYDPIINRLCTIFPACFSRMDPKPLKIGLGEELLAMAGAHPALANLTRTQMRRALQFHTQRPGYRRALAKGGPRHGLDGQVAGTVTSEQQAFAQSPRARNPTTATPAVVPPMDFTVLLQDLIAMAIPGKLDVTLKINQLPQAKPASPRTLLFAVQAGGHTVVVELKTKAWITLKATADSYPSWVAAMTGKLGEAIAGGFRLENPSVQMFEKKLKPEAASASNSVEPAATAATAPEPLSSTGYAKMTLKGRVTPKTGASAV